MRPPVPARDVHDADAGVNGRQQQPRHENIIHGQRYQAAENRHAHSGDDGDDNVVPLRRVFHDEWFVEIVDDVRRAPVNLRADGWT